MVSGGSWNKLRSLKFRFAWKRVHAQDSHWKLWCAEKCCRQAVETLRWDRRVYLKCKADTAWRHKGKIDIVEIYEIGSTRPEWCKTSSSMQLVSGNDLSARRLGKGPNLTRAISCTAIWVSLRASELAITRLVHSYVQEWKQISPECLWSKCMRLEMTRRTIRGQQYYGNRQMWKVSVIVLDRWYTVSITVSRYF